MVLIYSFILRSDKNMKKTTKLEIRMRIDAESQSEWKRERKLDKVLGTLEIAVDDLVRVEVVHAAGDLHGPVEGEPRRNGAAAVAQQVVQRPVRTELHDDAVARRFRTHAPVRDHGRYLESKPSRL